MELKRKLDEFGRDLGRFLLKLTSETLTKAVRRPINSRPATLAERLAWNTLAGALMRLQGYELYQDEEGTWMLLLPDNQFVTPGDPSLTSWAESLVPQPGPTPGDWGVVFGDEDSNLIP